MGSPKTETTLRVIVSHGGGEPRVFELRAEAPEHDVGEAVSAGARAFGAAFNSSLDRARRASARRPVERAARTPATIKSTMVSR